MSIGRQKQLSVIYLCLSGKPKDNAHSWKAAFSITFLFAVVLAVGLLYQAKGKLKGNIYLIYSQVLCNS